MGILIKNVRVIDTTAGVDLIDDVFLSREEICIAPKKPIPQQVLDGKGLLLVPGLIDLHVHFREPGFCYKEDIASGIRAALAGGVTSALVMPNTRPALDTPKAVMFQYKRAQRFGFDLMVAAAASENLAGLRVSDIHALAKTGVRAITDDGKPISDDDTMEQVLRLCRLNNLVCMQHAENISVSQHAALNLGVASKKLEVLGQSNQAESSLVERDINLALRLGCRYHVLHLSCKESLKLVTQAKKISKKITCEVTPHHLFLSDQDVRYRFDTNKKMNPPLRDKNDVFALLDGICNQSIDAVASDHAPHSAKEKRLSLAEAPFGVVGLESAILILMTLVKKEGVPLKTAISLMTTGPARILGKEERIGTMFGKNCLKNAVLIDPEYRGIFSYKNLYGRSKNSPFLGMELCGKIKATFLNGKISFLNF